MLTFPNDFNKIKHPVVIGAFQYIPKDKQETFISIVGGGFGLYGNGIDTFEVMIDDDVTGWQSIEDINEILKSI